MQKYYRPKGKHLTIDNRRLIEKWKNEGSLIVKSPTYLERLLRPLITRSIGGTTLRLVRKGVYKKVYSADYAQTVYQSNRKRSVKKFILTKEIKEKILHYHKQKFSPEMMVKKKLPAEKSLEERPEVINLRLENGHYEIDTVLLTKVKNYCLLVLTDRRSRHQIIRLIPNKTAESVNQALKLILGEHHILSITVDNGSEFNRLAEVFPKEHIYYARPYSSWERGTNENHNRLIRRWLTKGTKKTTPKEVAFIENWVNNYPKKCLGYKSPSEFLLGG